MNCLPSGDTIFSLNIFKKKNKKIKKISKFEKMAAAAASRVVEKRFLTDDEFYKVPEKFYGFHDEYKR